MIWGTMRNVLIFNYSVISDVWVEDEKTCVSVVLIYPLKKAKGGLRVLTDSVTYRSYEPNPPSFLITLFF